MCDPVSITLGSVAAASAVAGGVNGYLSNRAAGDKAMSIAEANARLANQSADYALQSGEVDAGKVAQKASQIIGSGRTIAAENGVDVSSGSTARAFTDTAMLASMDEDTVRNNAAREAWGMRAQGANFIAQGKAAKAADDSAAFSSILGGISGAASAGMSAASAGGLFQSTPKAPGGGSIPYYLARP